MPSTDRLLQRAVLGFCLAFLPPAIAGEAPGGELATPSRASAASQDQRLFPPPQVPARAQSWTALVSGLEAASQLPSAQPRRSTLLAGAARSAAGQSRAKTAPTFRAEGYLRNQGGDFTLTQAPQPRQPLEPAPTEESMTGITPRQPLIEEQLANFGFAGPSSAPVLRDEDRAEQFESIRGVASATNQEALAVNAQPDLAEAISKDVLSVQTQWRSSISESPFIRGFKNRQIYAQLNGQYFEPVRWDLDTIVSKVDPGIVQDVIVIDGPYSVQYGPGFTFMDIVTFPTPRCQPAQYRTSTSWLPNGQQIYGRETVSGGTQNFGYRFSYGHRNANNYRAGNGQYIPSHYNNGDILAEVGYNLSGFQRLELGYRRLDQNHTAYPGQFFDVSALQTNAFNMRYIDEDPTRSWTRLIAQGWYNQNSMAGNTFDITKQGVVQNVERSLTSFFFPGIAPGVSLSSPNFPIFAGFSGSTVGNLTSTGGRVTVQYGELDELSLLAGVDARVIDQRVSEYFTISPFYANASTGTFIPVPQNFATGMPRATMVNPGAFAETTVPWTTYFRSKLGARGDFVGTNANPATLPPNTGSLLPTGLSQTNGLYSFYMVNQLDLNEHWNANLSFGQAQRPPSLIDRYADGMFLGIIQSGYRRVIGDPNLRPERNWQIDLALNGNYENWRGYVRGYQSWVKDYITYSENAVRDPTGAVLLNTLNTPLAELRGFEAFNSFDLTPRITPFASAHYVYGIDQTIMQPLTQIPPLQGFAGVRFHDPNGGAKWGLEAFATITREQSRPGVIRVTNVPGALFPIEMRTGGWTIYNLRGYWNVSKNMMVSGGINNIFDKSYITHLALRTPPIYVFSPGISPYVSMDWVY